MPLVIRILDSPFSQFRRQRDLARLLACYTCQSDGRGRGGRVQFNCALDVRYAFCFGFETGGGGDGGVSGGVEGREAEEEDGDI